MKMNRTNTAGRILALLLTALMVLSLAACGTKGGDKMDGMSSEPKNAEEAVAMHKELMAQENAILSEDTALWEKVFMAADKGMTLQEDGKNYGEFLLDTIEGAKDQFTERMAFSCAISSLCRASASSAFFGSSVMAESLLLISAFFSLSFVPHAAKDSTSRTASSSAVNF